MKASKKLIVKRALFVIASILLVIGAAEAGYRLSSRYKETILNAYDSLLDNVSERIESFRDNLLDETSSIED